MKSELLHLLHKLKAEHPDAQNIVISIHGAPIAVTLQHNVRRFESLDALEAYAWPAEDHDEVGPVAPRGPLSTPSPRGEGRGEGPLPPPILKEEHPRASGYVETPI